MTPDAEAAIEWARVIVRACADAGRDERETGAEARSVLRQIKALAASPTPMAIFMATMRVKDIDGLARMSRKRKRHVDARIYEACAAVMMLAVEAAAKELGI